MKINILTRHLHPGVPFGRQGSGLAKILDPCIDKFLETKAYYDACVKHSFVSRHSPGPRWDPQGCSKVSLGKTGQKLEELDCASILEGSG